MWSAPKQLRQLLDNLRTELYGERAYFKNAIKQARTMMSDFRALEAPFLDDDEDSKDLDIEKSGKVSLRGDYGRMDLRRRILWLQTKDDFMVIQDQVTRTQARRIAYETSNTLSCVRDVERRVQDLDDRLYALEDHFLGETLDDGKLYMKRRYASK
ncbi:MAG: hypothetical protein Q9221_000185 [Calogaya cf. arnoldii]